MKTRNKRAENDFGMSFLDCICCGFGAIVLLFVITMGSASQMIQSLRDRLNEIAQQRMSQMAELEEEEEVLTDRARAAAETVQLAEERREQMADIKTRLEARIAALQAAKEKLLVDIDAEKDEIASLQKELDLALELPSLNLPVGLPVESNYIAFVFDTSGSMRDTRTEYLHEQALAKIQDVLNSYPEIVGMQFLDADGRFILRGMPDWIPDQPQVRENALRALATYPIYSNSNPVPGIFRAIRSLYQPANDRMHMAVFVFGDEFTGQAEPVIARLEAINPRKEDGRRHVSINAVGFPTVLRYPLIGEHTGMKFANLMREVTYKHDGAFIAVR